MELRGHRRAKKPQSGLFSRHYYTGSPASAQGGEGIPRGTKQKAPQASLWCFMYQFRLVLNDGAAGAGIRAGTAVQASTGIDDELVIALRDGTSGASVRTSAAAQAGRSDLVGHGKHLHKNLSPYSSILCEKSKNFPEDFERKIRESFSELLFINCLPESQRKSKIRA